MTFIMKVPVLNKLDKHMQEVVQGASVAFILKALAAALAFTFNLMLARFLGAEKTGLYYLALSCATIAAIIGRVGLDNTLVRFIATNKTAKAWHKVKGAYTKSIKLATMASSAAAILLFFLAPWLSETVFSKPELTSLIRWMAFAVVPLALFTLHSQALQGLKFIRDAILVLSVLLPLFSIINIAILVPTYGIDGAVWSYTSASFFTLTIGYWLWRKATPELRNIVGLFDSKILLQSSIPLFWMSIMTIFFSWSSQLMLGIWSDSHSVGIFGVANQCAKLISFVLIAVNSISAPKFAALYAENNLKSIGFVARKSAKLMMFITLPILLVYIFASESILGVFGKNFSSGSIPLIVLSIGQFINVITGSVGYLLMMSGNEIIVRNIAVICAAEIICLNLLLTPNFGMVGAAIATATTMSSYNLLCVYLAWKKLGICTIPIMYAKHESVSEQ